MKNRPTRRQTDILAERRAASAQRRETAGLTGSPRGMFSAFQGLMFGSRPVVTPRPRDPQTIVVDKYGDEIFTRTYEWLHQHTDAPRRSRQPGKRGHRSRNRPYINPDRDLRSLKPGRLRRELVPDATARRDDQVPA